MSISIDDLKAISDRFDFFETRFDSNEEEKDNFGHICEAEFALEKYNGTAPSSGEWISVVVLENRVEVGYTNTGIAGPGEDYTKLSVDATKKDIEQAIREYL